VAPAHAVERPSEALTEWAAEITEATENETTVTVGTSTAASEGYLKRRARRGVKLHRQQAALQP